MVIKHDFGLINNTNNIIWGVMLEVNNATSGFLGLSLLALIFIVSVFVGIRRTQDLGKSFATSLHITTVLGLLLYYAGKVSGYEFIIDVVMLGLIVAEILLVGALYYFRTNKD